MLPRVRQQQQEVPAQERVFRLLEFGAQTRCKGFGKLRKLFQGQIRPGIQRQARTVPQGSELRQKPWSIESQTLLDFLKTKPCLLGEPLLVRRLTGAAFTNIPDVGGSKGGNLLQPVLPGNCLL